MMPIDSPTMSMLKNALDGLAHRQTLLSSNIANANTPGFVARELDFKHVMTGLERGQTETLGLQATSERHLLGTGGGADDVWQNATTFGAGPPDVKQQMVAVSENGLHFAAVAQALTQQLSRYRMAIREGR